MRKLVYALIVFSFFPLYQVLAQCDPGKVEITVTILTDLNGDENDWTLKQGSTTLLSGGPYTAGKRITDVQTVCVNEGAELMFTFHDMRADGIGDGYFRVESCGNTLAYHTGYMSSYKKAWIKAQPCKLAGEGEVEIYSYLVRPSTMNDLRWSITGPGGSPVYGQHLMDASATYEFLRTAVPEGIPLEYNIVSLDGRGISLNGSYEVGYECVQIAKGGQDFDIIKTIPFTAPYSGRPNNVFEHKIDNVDYDHAYKIEELCQGGYIITGVSGPENISPGHQALLIKISPDGDIIWSKEYGGNDNEISYDVQQLSDGGFIGAGTLTPQGGGAQYGYVFRTDYEGNLLWDKTISNGFSLASVLETPDGGFMVAGETRTLGAGNTDAYVAKLNATGDLLWERPYGNAFANAASSIVRLYNGDFLVAGQTSFSDSYNASIMDGWIFRINAKSSIVYEKFYGGESADYIQDLKMIDYQNAVAAGWTNSATPGQTKTWLLKFDIKKGDTVWTKAFGETGTERGYSVSVAANGNLLVTGTGGNWYEKTQFLSMTLLNSGGDEQWTRSISQPGSNHSGMYGIAASDGGYVFTGDSYFESFPENRPDIYYLKTDDNGRLVSVPVIRGDSIICAGDKASIEASRINVESGITYTWSNGATGRTIEVSKAGDYTVTVTDKMGNAKTSAPFTVTTIPVPEVQITTESDPKICFGTTIDMSAGITNRSSGRSYSYLWNTGETDSLITTDSEGKYWVRVTDDDYGCTGFSAGFEVTVQRPYNDEEICIVSVDPESGKNMVVFSKTQGVGTKAFIIWKESNAAYVYEPIGAVPYNEPNIYIDYGSSPGTQADRYRISVLDVCDNQSLKSKPHKTMHLTVNAGGGGLNANNLIWDDYEGFPFGTYTIYRGTSPDKLDSIHAIQSSLTSWTDDNPPEGNLYYRVGVRKREACYLVSEKKASGGPFAHSLSNLEDNKLQATGMDKDRDAMNELVVYPNPYSGFTNIVYSVEQRSFVRISVYNSLGQKVTDLTAGYQDPSDYHYRFSARQFNQPAGMYMIRVQIGNQTMTKMVMEK